MPRVNKKMLLKITHNKTIIKYREIKPKLSKFSTMLKPTLLMFIQTAPTARTANLVLGRIENPSGGPYIWVILGIFLSFSVKAHKCYPAYHIGADSIVLDIE